MSFTLPHSDKLARGAAEMVRQIAEGVRIIPAGGTDDGRVGTSYDLITAAIAVAEDGSGVLLLPDLGSAVLTAQSVIEDLAADQRKRVRLVDAPFVEGAVAAGVAATSGLDLRSVADAAEEARDARKL